MADTAQNIIDLYRERSTAQILVDIRKRLARNMLVRIGGFEYQSLFGCNADARSSLSPSVPHIAVRVELRRFVADDFRFDAFVDFHLPVAASIKEAEDFKRATSNAVKKAKWAQDLVRGLIWDLKTISSLEVK